MTKPLTDGGSSNPPDTDKPTSLMCLVIAHDKAFAAAHPIAAGVCAKTGGYGISPSPNHGSVPPGTPSIPGIISGATGWVSDLLNALDPLLQWLSNPGRVFKLLVGVGILFVALLLLIAPDILSAAQETAKAAAKGEIPA